MSARANIKCLDTNAVLSTSAILSSSATTASDRTLSPAGTDANGVAWWEDRSGGISIGFPKFSMSRRAPTKASRLHRVQAKCTIPILEAVSGDDSSGFTPPPTVAYTLSANLEFLLPERSTAAERTRIFGMMANMLITTLNASDLSPNEPTGTPLIAQVVSYDDPF